MAERAEHLSVPATAGPSSPGEAISPPADLLVCRLVDWQSGMRVTRSHGSSSWLALWTVGGAGRVRQGDVEVTALPGQLVVLGSHVGHEYQVDPRHEHWAIWWVHYQPRSGWLSWLRPSAVGSSMYVVGPVPPVVRESVAEVWLRLHAYLRWAGSGPLPSADPVPARQRAASAAHPLAYELGLSTLEEIVLVTSSVRRESGDLTDQDQRVRTVIDLISADPGAAHTVDSLARAVALSPSRLAHLFVDAVGRTLMQEVRVHRIRHAARLLDGTDLSVAAVAAAAGFPNPFHFSKTFAAETGLPPSRYRLRARHRDPSAMPFSRQDVPSDPP